MFVLGNFLIKKDQLVQSKDVIHGGVSLDDIVHTNLMEFDFLGDGKYKEVAGISLGHQLADHKVIYSSLNCDFLKFGSSQEGILSEKASELEITDLLNPWMITVGNSELKKYTETYLLAQFILESKDLENQEKFRPITMLLIEKAI